MGRCLCGALLGGHGFDDQLVSHARIRIRGGAGGQFQHGMRRQAGGDTPRRHRRPHFADPVVLRKIDQIDGKPHEEGVDRFAGTDPETFTRGKALMLQQAGAPLALVSATSAAFASTVLRV